MEYSNQKHNFISYIFSYLTISVLAGLFTFRLINSLLDSIILPTLSLTLLPDNKFNKLSYLYDSNKNKIPIKSQKEHIYGIQIGSFIKELILWTISMIVLFCIYKFI